MTLQNGLVHGKKAYLWCDTAMWDDSGQVIGQVSKAFGSPSLEWTGTVSFWGPPPDAMTTEISTAHVDSLERLLEVATDAMRKFVLSGGNGRIMLASYFDRPRLHMIATDDLFPGSGYGPLEAVEINYFISSCNDSAPAKIAARKGMNPKRMRRVIDAQCETPFEGSGAWVGLGKRIWVGGEVIRIEVGHDGVDIAIERKV